MKNFNYFIPVNLVYGCGRINELPKLLPQNVAKIMLVTEKNLAEKTNAVEIVGSLLKDKEVITFLDVEENPSFECVEQGGRIAKENNVDLIIGLGGGSPMDAAKGIAVTAVNNEPLRELIKLKDLPVKPLPVICIPTTSGTGSEATPFAVFTDHISMNKCGYGNNSIFPVVSIIDPELTYTMPRSVIINTGLDVLAHSIEAFLSTDANEFNDLIALEAASIAAENLINAADGDKAAMNKMSYASMLAGIAITHASTILPHIMGYPLTVYHNVPHGRASAIILPAFLKYLKANGTDKEKAMRAENIFIKQGGIDNFFNKLGVSCSLREYGIREDELSTYAGKVIVKGDVKITPAVITEEIIIDIYKMCI